MSRLRPHCSGKSGAARRWSWLPPVLALLSMLLPVTGWPASAQLQNLCIAANGSDDGENELPGDDEGSDADDGDMEAHLLIRRLARESLPPAAVAESIAKLAVEGETGCSSRFLHRVRKAAACSAARLPLRC
jgi:hypothetical protein